MPYEQAVYGRPIGADQHHPRHPKALAPEACRCAAPPSSSAGFLLTLLLSAYALETLKFSPGSIIAFRVAMVMIFGALAGYFFVLPQWRRVTDEQVALYLEECEPSLETAILSALEAEKGSSSHSPALARRLVEHAIERCGVIERGRRLETQPLRRYAIAIAGTTAAALLLFVLGPAYLRQGASALLLMAGDVLEASPYRINVKPGSTTVPRGSDQVIIATVQGFESDKAELLIRKSISAQFEHVPMVFNNDTKTFEGMLFDLPGSIDYFVESGGVKSDVFTMHAADLPYVKQLEMEYVFPGYTGLAPRKIENGGDIAVLQGTQVRVRITPTMKSPSGRILLDGGTAISLAPEGDVFTGDDPGHQGRLLSHRAAGRPREQARERVAAIHDRRARRSGADRVDCKARPRHDRIAGRRVRDRSARR